MMLISIIHSAYIRFMRYTPKFVGWEVHCTKKTPIFSHFFEHSIIVDAQVLFKMSTGQWHSLVNDVLAQCQHT